MMQAPATNHAPPANSSSSSSNSGSGSGSGSTTTTSQPAAVHPEQQRRLTPQQQRLIVKGLHVLKDRGFPDTSSEILYLVQLLRDRGIIPCLQVSHPLAHSHSQSGSTTTTTTTTTTQSSNSSSSNSQSNGKDGLGEFRPTAEELEQAQLFQLRAQLMSYKMITKNLPVPQELQLAAAGLPTYVPPVVVDVHGVPVPVDVAQKRREQLGSRVMAAVQQVQSQLSPRNVVNMLHAKRILVPSQLPLTVDLKGIQVERERLVQCRIDQRIQDLQSLPANIPNELKMKAVIELKALRLRLHQRQLRTHILSAMRKATFVDSSTAKAAFRKLKKQTMKEARVTEKLERQQQYERELRDRQQKQKRKDELAAIIQHSKDMKEQNRNLAQRAARLGKSILQWHANTDREEQKKKDRMVKERIRMLREDDETAYREHVDQQKDTRITYLLQQTDKYLAELGSKILELKKDDQPEEEGAETAGEGEGAKPPTGEEGEGAKPAVEEGEGAKPPTGEREREGAKPPAVEDSEKATASAEVPEAAKPKPAVPEAGASAAAAVTSAVAAGQTGKASTATQEFYRVAHSVTESISAQPSLLVGGELKDYQLKGLEWMVSLYNNNLNGILADEMGLGKTIQTIALLGYLMEAKKLNGPYLIIVPLSTMPNWRMEFQKWAPDISVLVYNGALTFRKQLQQQVRQLKFNVLLTTYEFVMRDKAVLSKVKYVSMIVDEGHRMKNAHCKLTTMLAQFYSSKHRMLLTGTPLQNNLPELWALLNFLLPSIFKSVKSFEEWFNAPFANTGERVELNEEEQLLVISRLHKVLRPFMLRRLKSDVESQLPDKVEKVLKCNLSGAQRVLYDQIEKGCFYFKDGSSKIQRRGINNTIMQLRKVCNHPFVFREVEDMLNPQLNVDEKIVRTSGKFELLDRILPKLQRTNHKVLIFFQMTNVMNIFQDYCNWKNFTYLRLDGATKAEDRREAMDTWNDPTQDYFLFLLSTRAGGLGLNLQTADTVIIFDSDWNPHQDMQAQDRAHRIGQKNEVRVYRLVCSKSVEEIILERAHYKLDVDSKVIQAGKFDQKTTVAEQESILRALFQEDKDNQDDEIFDDEELNEILGRSPEEVEIFTKIDDEIARSRLEAWRQQGRKGRPSRLMEEEELPDGFRNAQKLSKEQDEAEKTVKRQRTEVSYDDGLTEAQWLRIVDSGGSVDEVLEKRKKAKEQREKKKARTAAVAATAHEDNESSGSSSPATPVFTPEDDSPRYDSPSSSRKNLKRKSTGGHAAEATPTQQQPLKRLRLTLHRTATPTSQPDSDSGSSAKGE